MSASVQWVAMRAIETPMSRTSLQVAGEADAGQQQHRDPARGSRRRPPRAMQRVLVVRREAVVEGRAAQAVAVADLDDRHARGVEGARDGRHLLRA